MANYPDDVSPASPDAPWNKQRTSNSVNDEISCLYAIEDAINYLQSYMELCDLSDLFSTNAFQEYDTANLIDMLEAAKKIAADRIKKLEAL